MTAGNSNVSKYKKTYNVAWSPPPEKKKETLWDRMKKIITTIKQRRAEEQNQIDELLGN